MPLAHCVIGFQDAVMTSGPECRETQESILSSWALRPFSFEMQRRSYHPYLSSCVPSTWRKAVSPTAHLLIRIGMGNLQEISRRSSHLVTNSVLAARGPAGLSQGRRQNEHPSAPSQKVSRERASAFFASTSKPLERLTEHLVTEVGHCSTRHKACGEKGRIRCPVASLQTELKGTKKATLHHVLRLLLDVCGMSSAKLADIALIMSFYTILRCEHKLVQGDCRKQGATVPNEFSCIAI